MRRDGTTLLELLVVTVVFSLILTVVLGFYVWGHNTTASQSRIADNDRRMMQMVERIRTLVTNAEIERVTASEIDFTPVDTTTLDRRVGNVSSAGAALVVLPAGAAGRPTSTSSVVLRTQGRTETILQLQSYETVSFQLSGNSLSIQDNGNPPVSSQAQGQEHAYSITRQVLLEPPF